MPPTHDQEELLNGKLAELLAAQGLDARPERRESGKRMDIVVDVGGARVVLEAEAGFSAAKRREAVKDADARLKQGLTTVVFAVCYPDGATTDTLAESKPIWSARTRSELSGGATARWSEPGGIPELAEAVRQAGGAVGDADGAAQILSEALDAAVQRLSTPTREVIARQLDLRAETADDRKLLEPHQRRTDGYFIATKRGLLVVATAILFHHRLHGHLPDDCPSNFDGTWPPQNPAQCAAEPETTLSAFAEAWRAILAVDYRPVFETARVALLALPATPDIAQAIHTLAGEVAKIASLVHGLRHDLLGRIFHRVLDTARYDGSYYTSTAAAVLLAALAIRDKDRDWTDPNAIERLRICDPACGTGTLLMAAAERIRSLRLRPGLTNSDDEEILALALVENVLWGYDINITATHMAASTLGMLSPSTKFGHLNIHRTVLGIRDGSAHAGSLEFLDQQPVIPGWPRSVAVSQVDDETEHAADPPDMDLVIMNPPFTRASLLHDQFSLEEEAAVKDREKEILDGHPHRAAARLHSLGGMFIVLGDSMIKDRDACLAMVLPLVVPTAPGNQALREYLASTFHVDLIVSSHDPDRIYMSENTSIGEVLIICRRWQSNEPKPPTRFVNLARNPANGHAASEVARQIERGSGDFTLQRIDAARMAKGDWYAVNFLSESLREEYEHLAAQSTSLESIAHVGGQGRSVPTAYRRSTTPTASGRRAFWEHDSEAVTCLAQRAADRIEPKPGKSRMADRYWKERSRLLVGERVRLNTMRVMSVHAKTKTIGSAWVTIRPHDQRTDTEQALCAYLNSSVGILARLGKRSNRVPSYPRFALPDIRETPVPNFPELGDDVRDALAATYEQLKDEVLLPFPRMDDDPVRKRLDAAVADALSLDLEWVAQIRRALSEEPSVTNRRYAGLAT